MKGLPYCLRIAAVCLVAVFVVNSAAKILRYNDTLTAVPLWMFLALDAMLFLLPAAVLLLAAHLLKNHSLKKRPRGKS